MGQHTKVHVRGRLLQCASSSAAFVKTFDTATLDKFGGHLKRVASSLTASLHFFFQHTSIPDIFVLYSIQRQPDPALGGSCASRPMPQRGNARRRPLVRHIPSRFERCLPRSSSRQVDASFAACPAYVNMPRTPFSSSRNYFAWNYILTCSVRRAAARAWRHVGTGRSPTSRLSVLAAPGVLWRSACAVVGYSEHS